jgi:hypothetical protein
LSFQESTEGPAYVYFESRLIHFKKFQRIVCEFLYEECMLMWEQMFFTFECLS